MIIRVDVKNDSEAFFDHEVGYSFSQVVAVTGILGLAIRHGNIFTPDADHQELFSLANASSSASHLNEVSSGRSGSLSRLMLVQNKFNASKPYSRRTRVPVSLRCSFGTLEFIHIYFLDRAKAIVYVVVVCVETRPVLVTGHLSTIHCVDGSMQAGVVDCILFLFVTPSVLDVVHILVPPINS